jgi:hypothetical protein
LSASLSESGSGDKLVEAVSARNSIEAGMLQGLLEDAGIPCMLRPYGVNGPQLGVALLPQHGGPQQVMVHANRLEEARAALDEALIANPEEALAPSAADLEGGRGPRSYGLLGAYARILFWSFLAMAAAAGAYFLLHL